MLPDGDHAGGFQCGEAVAMVICAKEFKVLRLDADVVGAPLRDRLDHVGGPAAVGKVETLALQSERGKFLEPMFATGAAVMIDLARREIMHVDEASRRIDVVG